MKSKICKWWNGSNRTYATSDDPSPKEAFRVVVFFIIPMYTILFLIIKYKFHAQL